MEKSFIKNAFSKAVGTLALALSCAVSPFASAEWSVNGGQILDPNGNPFVYRGVNLGTLPSMVLLPQVYADIAATGANAIRIPIDNLTPAQAEVHVNLCKQNNLVCVFAHTLSAGYVDNNIAPGSLYILDVWARYADLLKANEDYVVIDLASALAGNIAWLDYYISIHQTGIFFVRNIWELKNQVIISGGNWGQDWGFMMRDNAEALMNLDPMKNIVFSVHMYEAYRDEQSVRSYLEDFTALNLPIIVGEFGPIKRDRIREYKNPFNTFDVDVEAIMEISQELGVGYLGWSWSGYRPNTDPSKDFTALNLVNDFDPQQLTPWGDLLIHGDHGIQATAIPATHFPVSSSSSSSVPNRPPLAEIIYELNSGDCGAMSGLAIARAYDPDEDEHTYSWEIYQSKTGNTTFGGGSTIYLSVPAENAATLNLKVNDGNGHTVDTTSTFRNPNSDTCANSSIPASSAPSSISPSTSSRESSSSSLSTSVRSSIATSSSKSSSSVRSSSSSVRSSSSSAAALGNCRYVLNSQWDNGFTASVRITNNGTQTIQGWNVNWNYSDGSKITGSWNTNLSGNNPYSAKNVNWNATISPGQTVEFGFQGNKPKGAAQIPVITGSICQ
jgi:mannan endo-1,4-beta-mannosidase